LLDEVESKRHGFTERKSMYNEHERTQRAWEEHLKAEHDEPGSMPSADCDACAWYCEELRGARAPAAATG
jgi:hypothetical protein